MTEQTRATTPLKEVYAGWEQFNKRLVTLVAPLTPEQLAIRTAQNQREVVKIIAHIISARAWWFHERLAEGDAKWEQYYTWDEDDGPTLNAAQLELGLEETWRLISECLARWTTDDLGGEFPTSHDGMRTRQWVIWHVIEHDLFHGGEVSFALGSSGVPGIDL